MKEKILICLSFIFILFALTGCQSRLQEERTGLKIVTSFYPIYAMTKEISGERNDVKMIQSGAGIHDFEPSVHDVQAIYDADVFIYHSSILESWANRLDVNLRQSDVLVFEASQGMGLERVSGLEDMELSDGIAEASLYDPHTWVDPLLVAEEVELIAEQLSQLDPEGTDIYQQNAQRLIQEAESLYQRFKPRFAQVRTKTFVTQHTAFSYLAKRFGLEQLGIANVSNQEPSPRQLAEILDFIATYEVSTIFTERGTSDKLARTLQNSYQVELKVLDPLEADPENNLSYLENLEHNLLVLLESLDN